MFDVNTLLSNPANTPCGVISNVSSIFLSQWMTFLTISLLQTISLLLTSVISCLVIVGYFFFVFVKYGASPGLVVPLLILIVASAIAVGWVWCVYAGAMVRAAVETCAGGNPSACPTVSEASKRAGNMLGFQLIFGLLMCAGGLVLRRVLHWLGGDDGEDDDDFYPDFAAEGSLGYSLLSNSPSTPSTAGFIFLICFLYAVLLFVVNVSMIGAVPTIVVEGKSSCSALLRSWNLCKNSICFIFLSILSVNVIYTCICIISWAIMDAIAHGNYYINLSALMIILYMAMLPIAMITSVVLYLSLRVRFEGLTHTQLSQSLLLTRPEPSAPPATEEDTANLLLSE